MAASEKGLLSEHQNKQLVKLCEIMLGGKFTVNIVKGTLKNLRSRGYI